MTKTITYTATYAGNVVGSRKSPRPYLFAVIALHDEAAARKSAYEFEPHKQMRRDFDHLVVSSQRTAGDRIRYVNDHSDGRVWYSQPIKQEEIDRDKARVAGGWEGYVADHKAAAITHFETRVAKGYYKPHVHGWSMSRPNAEKMARACSSKVLAIVDAVAK